MTLWERSDALAMLEEMHRDTAEAGRIALVAGEAGIGKSALIRAFAQRCGSRARVLLGLCDPLVTPRASGPLHDIARSAGGALAEGVEARSPQSELFGALVAELTGPRQRPRRIVVIEDAHWADEATHDLVVFLGRRIERLPAMLILTYRDDEIGPEHPLRATLAVLPRQVVRAVPLRPLSKACVAKQAASAGLSPGDATLDAVKAAPEAAKFQFRASNVWLSGTHNRSTIDGFFGVGEERSHERTFYFDADHPAVLVGRDNGPTPVEYVLHALAACLTAGLANIAAARGVRLTEVRSTVVGDIDLNGILGLNRDVRNGYEKISVRFTVKGDASAEVLRAIVEQSRARSAVFDIITNGVPVTIEVDASS